ncbi:MAG: DmsC/YnfH family molybdoenzyme membrane anchor subunit [Candidatus Competibacterales bacterium]|nr:DmsC/YnfH family molybdoenzyme membrane anchor subunit [Candidatus Competibacterales bacterium]
MQPTLSLVVFTVSAGAGYGLLALTVLLAWLGAQGMPGGLLVAGIGALALITLGLLVSTRHLANPRNAWRAFSRFRSSWLSREAVFAVLLYPFALAWLALAGWQGTHGPAVDLLGLASALLALVTVYCTGMIYACLRTIRQWHNPLVPVNYLLLALASGALLLAAILATTGSANSGTAETIALALLVSAGLGKALYYHWIGPPQQAPPAGPSLNSALGLTRARVRLFDSGQSGGNYLTREFGYRPPARRLRGLRLAVLLLGFVVPASLLLHESAAATVAAALVALAGIGIERWLFFAEARHVVNLFYGEARV